MGGLLTSISHHDFLDWSILALWGRMGKAGEKTHPPHSQEAETTTDYSVPHHPEGKKEYDLEKTCLLDCGQLTEQIHMEKKRETEDDILDKDGNIDLESDDFSNIYTFIQRKNTSMLFMT